MIHMCYSLLYDSCKILQVLVVGLAQGPCSVTCKSQRLIVPPTQLSILKQSLWLLAPMDSTCKTLWSRSLHAVSALTQSLTNLSIFFLYQAEGADGFQHGENDHYPGYH